MRLDLRLTFLLAALAASVGAAPALSQQSYTGMNIVHIAYKGAAPALNDVVAGHVQLQFANWGSRRTK